MWIYHHIYAPGADTGFWKGGSGLNTKTRGICVHACDIFVPLFEVLGSPKGGGDGGGSDPQDPNTPGSVPVHL